MINKQISGSGNLAVAAALTTSTWTGASSTVWHLAANWSPNTAIPNIDAEVIIPDTSAGSNRYPVINSALVAQAYSIELTHANASLTIQTNLNVKDYIKNTAGGTITMQPTASILQPGPQTIANSGDVKLNQSVNLRYLDWAYWGSPFTGAQTLYNFFSGAVPDRYATYDGNVTTGMWGTGWIEQNENTVTFAPGEGYGIGANGGGYGTTNYVAYTPQFQGVPNNGNISAPLNTVVGSQLVGNPYPSALSSRKFIQANQAIMGGTLAFWTASLLVDVDDPYSYSTASYARLNLFGNTKTTQAGAYPGEFIPPGKAFMTSVSSVATPIVFDNSMRVHPNNAASPTELNRNRLWLNFLPPNPASDPHFVNILLGYCAESLFTGASAPMTNGFNKGYDSNKAVDAFDLYVLDPNISGSFMAINARPFSAYNVASSEFVLGFKTHTTGTHTITMDKKDGTEFNKATVPFKIYEWNGSAWNSIGDLKLGPVTFNVGASEVGVQVNTRFKLKFQ